MWTQEQDDEQYREEMLACMVEACLLHKNDSMAWISAAYEVIDVCSKVLDWRCANGDEERTYASMYYFMLLEEICKVEGSSELQTRKQ